MKRENKIVLVWVYSHNNLKGLKQTVKSFFDSTYIAKLIYIEDDNSDNQVEVKLFVDSAMQQGLTGYFNACPNHIGMIECLKSNTIIKRLDFDYILIIDDKCILDKNCVSNFVHYGIKKPLIGSIDKKNEDLIGWFLPKDYFKMIIAEDKAYLHPDIVENAVIHINSPKESKKFKKLKDMVGKIWKK